LASFDLLKLDLKNWDASEPCQVHVCLLNILPFGSIPEHIYATVDKLGYCSTTIEDIQMVMVD